MPTLSPDTKIAFLATDGVEQVELTQPWQAVKDAGATPVLVSLEAGTIQGFNGDVEQGDTGSVSFFSRAHGSISLNCFSVRTLTPRTPAFLSLEPAAVPATTKEVLADTEPEVLPPSDLTFSSASSRVQSSSSPVKTKVIPANGAPAAASLRRG